MVWHTCGRTDKYPTGPLFLFYILSLKHTHTYTHTRTQVHEAGRSEGRQRQAVFINDFLLILDLLLALYLPNFIDSRYSLYNL